MFLGDLRKAPTFVFGNSMLKYVTNCVPRYHFIVHFKELFALDGKPTNFDKEDLARRNTIVNLLEEWGLVKILDPEVTAEPTAPLSQTKIISFKDKDQWELIPKYNIGKKKKPEENQ